MSVCAPVTVRADERNLALESLVGPVLDVREPIAPHGDQLTVGDVPRVRDLLGVVLIDIADPDVVPPVVARGSCRKATCSPTGERLGA